MSASQVLTPDQATVEMAISSNAIAAMKISLPIDESDREGGERGGDLSRRAIAGSTVTLTSLSPGEAGVRIDNFLTVFSYR